MPPLRRRPPVVKGLKDTLGVFGRMLGFGEKPKRK